jgi:hypothetical protein
MYEPTALKSLISVCDSGFSDERRRIFDVAANVAFAILGLNIVIRRYWKPYTQKEVGGELDLTALFGGEELATSHIRPALCKAC